METGSAVSRLTPQVVNSQLASVDILSVSAIQSVTQILDHCMPAVPSGFYILSLVLKHLQRLCSKNLDINGNNDLHVKLCNLLKKCLHLVANICDSEKFDALWNTFSQTLQKCATGHKEVCSVAVQILSLPLLDLALSTSNTFSWQQKRDFLRLLREILSTADRTLNQNVGRSLDEYLCKLTELFLTCGDYEYQVSIMEVIFRYISIYKSRKSLKHWFNGQEPVYVAFSSIKFLDFDVDCRLFVNIVNESLGNNRQVYSFACLKAYLGQTELQKPRDEKYKEFWIDFNKGSKTVSFYCEGNQLLQDSHTYKSSWKLIVIHREMVKSAKLYKRNAVRSSRTGHCTVVIEFVKHDGNDDVSSTVLSQSYLKFFFDHTYQFSLSKDVLLPLFEEAFQELNSAKVTSYRSSVTPLIPVTLFKTARNRDSNKRVKVSVGELIPVNNQKKFEPLIIKKNIKHRTKEVTSAGNVQHGSLPFVQLHRLVSHTSDEMPDTQSSSDPAKDLKGKLTEQFIEKFTKRKMSLAISPQLSHVSEERLTEMGSASCSMQSASENNSSHNKRGKKMNKMSVSSQLCVTETKSRKCPLKDISVDSGELFEPVKLDSERGFTSPLSKGSPRVLLKKVHFSETSVSWPSHTDVIKYETRPAETATAYEANREQIQAERAELKSTGSNSISAKNPIKRLSNNLIKTNDYKGADIKITPHDKKNLISYAERGHSDLQNKLQISKAPKLESTYINIIENTSLKPDDANSLSDLDMFLQDETYGKLNATTPLNVHKLINTEGVTTPIDNLEEQLRVLHSDNCVMQPGSPKSFKSVNVQKEVVCNEKSVVPPSDLKVVENSNISRINLNCVTETQQTLIMVNSYKENETGMKKEQKNFCTTQFESHQSNATEETQIKNKDIMSQRSHSSNEAAMTITDNGQKSKKDFTGESKLKKKSSVLISKTSEALLADWEDNLDDPVSSKELCAASCIKANVQSNSVEDNQLNEQKLEINKIANSGIQNNLQSESKTTRKARCNDYPSETCEFVGGSDERKGTKRYYKGFSTQKKELIVGSHHSKNILPSSSKGESNKYTKKDIVIHHLPAQSKNINEHASGTKYVKNNSVTEIATVDTSFDILKKGKSNRLSKKRKLYTHSDSSTVISAQDFDDSNDTINDSRYGFMFARKKQRKSISSKQGDKRHSLAGGIFSLENSEDSACNANEVKQNSLNSFAQTFQLQFSVDKGYNRWYTRYKEECLQKSLNKQTRRSLRSWKDTSVYSDIESEDSTLSWLPPADEKKSKRRNEKLLEHLNRTARKYERKKPLSNKFKISSHSFTFANSTVGNDPEFTSNKNILELESNTKRSKELLKNRKISTLSQKCQHFDIISEKLHNNSKATESSSDDDKHLRNVPLSMRLLHDKTPNKTEDHNQLNNNSKRDNMEKTNSPEVLQKKVKKYGVMKILDLQKYELKLASAEDNFGSGQNDILSYHQIKSAFPSRYSKNKMETTEGLSTGNEQTESLSRSNGLKQSLSSRNNNETDNESFDKRENFTIMEKKYCNDEESTSSETSESIFNRMQKKVAVDKLKSYKNKQDSRSKDRALKAVDDLQSSSSMSYGKTAKDNKKHSKDKPEVKSTSSLSLSQRKIAEKEKEIHIKSAFYSSYSENKVEGTEGLSSRNDLAESLSRCNGVKQSSSSRNNTKVSFQAVELADESYHDERESFASMEEKYCNDKDNASSETSESTYVSRMQKKVVDRIKGYKNKQHIRPKDQALNVVDDLQPRISYGKTAKDKKKHSKVKPKVRSISPHSLSQEKIAEEEKEILCSNEGSIFNVPKTSYLIKKNEMKVKKKKKHNMKRPYASDTESNCSSEEQENIKKRQSILDRAKGIRNIPSSKSVCHISKEPQKVYTESSNKIKKETSKSNACKSQKKKGSLKHESVNDWDVIAFKQKYAYSNDLGPKCMKAISGNNDSRGSKIVSQPQFKFSKSSQNIHNRTPENSSNETINVSLDEQDAEQEILVSSENEDEIRVAPSASKHVSDESYISHHEASESTRSEISPRYHRSAKNKSSQRSNTESMHENVETVISSQDIFQLDENIAASDSKVAASINKDKNVLRSKLKKKIRHSVSNDTESSQGNKVKHSSQSPKQLSNISAVNSNFSYCFDDSKTDKLLIFQDNIQENEQANLLKGSVRLRQNTLKKDDVRTYQCLSDVKDDSIASQSSIGSSVNRPHSRHKCKEKICTNQAAGNITTTVVTTTGHSNHHDSSHDSTDSAGKMQEEKHNTHISVETKDQHKNWHNLSQSSTYSLKKKRRMHKTRRKSSRKLKALENKDDFDSEMCLGIKANNASLTNKQCTTKSSEEELQNAEPRTKLMYRQKVLKHEFKSDEFIITCTGDERAIAIEDGEGGVDMMVEKNTDLQLSSLLPWEDMKKLLCKRIGKLESYITSATETTQDHFINTCKEISASRHMFLKNNLQRMDSEIKASEEAVMELEKQEKKFTKAYSYLQHAYQKQTVVEKNLERRFSAQKNLFQNPKMSLQQKDEQNVLQKYTEHLQKDLSEMQNHYYKEECDEIRKKLQQRLMVSFRIEDMDA